MANLVGLILRYFLISINANSFEPFLTDMLRFFAPSQFLDPDLKGGYNDSINSDGALDAYVETVLWRLRGTHAMVRYLALLHLNKRQRANTLKAL
jgi:hypothetical protein